MTEDLRKRLYDAAIKRVNSNKMLSHGEGTGALLGFMWGAEYGFKEAIKVAKEWMQNYFPDELDGKGFEFVSRDEVIADFEADMNKLWEDIK